MCKSEEKVIVDLKKYENLKDANNKLGTELTRLNKLIEKEKVYFHLSEYRGSAYYHQDECLNYFKSARSIEFYNSLENSVTEKAIKGLESLLDEYERKMLDLFKIIVHRGKEKDVKIFLGEDFYLAHKEKLNEVHEAMRQKIIKEESDLIADEKTKRLQSKINKIPFWIKVIFNAE